VRGASISIPPVYIGSIGVALLLIAFALNLVRKLSERSAVYLSMNVVGALMAAWYAWAGGAIPFVILEIVWAATAAVRLVMTLMKRPTEGGWVRLRLRAAAWTRHYRQV